MRDVLIRLIVSDGKRSAPGPELPSGREMQDYLLTVLLASVPCMWVAAHYFGGKRMLSMVLVAFVGAALVEIAFGLVRKKPIGGGAVTFSVLLVLMLPMDIPLWMVFMGSAFGTMFGKEVFGGTGMHIFSPVLVGKGFLMFSYPKLLTQKSYFGSMLEFTLQGEPAPMAWVLSAVVILLGGAALALVRPSNGRIFAGIMFAGIFLSIGFEKLAGFPFESVTHMVVSDGFLLGAAFLACDPSISPRDDEAKWFYGLAIGSLAVLMRCFSNYTEAMLSAILIGNLFSPSLDMLAKVRVGRRVEQ